MKKIAGKWMFRVPPGIMTPKTLDKSHLLLVKSQFLVVKSSSLMVKSTELFMVND